MKRLGLVMIAAMLASLVGLAPAAAVATEWYAAPYGNDANACTSWAMPCLTIGAAVGKAAPGGTVHVAAGTYPESQIILSQSVTLLGAGIGQSIIDGGGGGGAATTGLIRVTSGAGNVTVSGFTLQNAKGDGSATPVRIYVLATGGGNQTYEYLKIIGSGLDDSQEYGFYSSYNAANVTLMHSDVSGTGANAVIFERHTGTSEVALNSVAPGAFGSEAYYSRTHGAVNVSALQTVHHNTFDMGACSDTVDPKCSDYSTRSSAVTFASSFPGSGAGTYSNVEISDNYIYNLKANRRGPGLWNGESGSGGAIANARILRNKIVGVSTTGTQGITLINQHTGTIIQGNSVTGVEKAFWGREYNAGYGSGFASGTVMNNNAFASSTKFQWDDPVNTLVAEYNWWGDVDGPCPPASQPACTGLGLPVSARVDYDPFAAALVSTVTGSTHEIGETSTMTTTLTVDGIYGAQLRVTHDPSVLSFTSGVTLSVPAQGWYWDLVQESFVAVATPTGRRLSGAMQGPGHPTPANLSNADIATWTYTCSGVGTSNLTYDTTTGGFGTVLSDKDGFQINAALIGDSITCVEATGSVSGTIQLQGRVQSHTPNGWDDAVVTFTCSSGACGSHVYVFSTGVSGAYSKTKTGPGTGMAQGNYNVTGARHEYLYASTTAIIGAGLTTMTTPKLLGGDSKNMGSVTIGDVTCIGYDYGTSNNSCTGGSSDINGDGIVNIFDLVLAAGNYTLSTSNPWPI